MASCTLPPIRQQNSLIISISGRNQVILSFFCMELVIKGSTWYYYFWFGVASCTLYPITLQDSTIINTSGQNQVIHLSAHCHLIFLFYLFSCIFEKFSGNPFGYGLLVITAFFCSWYLFPEALISLTHEAILHLVDVLNTLDVTPKFVYPLH